MASIFGLLLPGLDDGTVFEVAGGLGAGPFLLGARALLGHRRTVFGERRSQSLRLSILVFAVLFVHSLPEGFAIGTAYASDTSGLSLFVIVAIAVQNIPEGTSVAIPMARAGFGAGRQFWAAVGTSAPQPAGAVDRLPARRTDQRRYFRSPSGSPPVRCSRWWRSSLGQTQSGQARAGRRPARRSAPERCSA